VAGGFRTQIADSREHARQLVLEVIPDGAEVHSALAETMRELGITDETEESGRYGAPVACRMSAGLEEAAATAPSTGSGFASNGHIRFRVRRVAPGRTLLRPAPAQQAPRPELVGACAGS
jgi:hypothetical protein